MPHGLSLSSRRTAPYRRRDRPSLLLGILPPWLRYIYYTAYCTIHPPHQTLQYKDACCLIRVPVRLQLKLDLYSSHKLTLQIPWKGYKPKVFVRASLVVDRSHESSLKYFQPIVGEAFTPLVVPHFHIACALLVGEVRMLANAVARALLL